MFRLHGEIWLFQVFHQSHAKPPTYALGPTLRADRGLRVRPHEVACILDQVGAGGDCECAHFRHVEVAGDKGVKRGGVARIAFLVRQLGEGMFVT